jgi:antitoxin VapB
MGIFIKDPATDKVVRELAELEGVSLTEAVRTAATSALAEAKAKAKKRSVRDSIKAIQDRFAQYPKTGLKADKAFYDSLNDE